MGSRLMFLVMVVLLSPGITVLAGEIHEAARSGNLDAVKLMLTDNPGLIETPDERGMTPLHWAAYNNHEAVVEFLLDQGADIDIARPNGSTPLHGAAYYGHLEVARLLIDRGADIHTVNDSRFTPLISAVNAGHVEIAALLIENGADIEARDNFGMNPLHHACSGGKPAMLRLLIDNGVDLATRRSESGMTALHVAAATGSEEIAALLLEHGADVNAVDNAGATALHQVTFSRDTIILDLLADHGANIDAPDSYGNTPLFWAARIGFADIVDGLLRHGADVNRKGENGMTPLQIALKNGRADQVGSLLDHGAATDVTDARLGRTPLHTAAIMGLREATELLLDAGADANAVDGEGNTPYAWAARFGNRSTADLLAAHGADTADIAKNFGPSPLLNRVLDGGSAVCWYLGHCGWAIKTKNNLLIFDYFTNNEHPAEPLLANGHISPEEIANLTVTVFVTHEHADHFDTTIFGWRNALPDLTYIFGFRPEETNAFRGSGYTGPAYEFIGPRENRTLGGMEITTIAANDAGVGFLVAVDGLTLYHAGDHAGWREGERDGFIQEIDHLARRVSAVDLAFLNVTGCHMQDTAALFEGNSYTVNKLSPKVMIPTHGLHMEHVYEEAAEKMRRHGIQLEYVCPKNRGDHYAYLNGRITQL